MKEVLEIFIAAVIFIAVNWAVYIAICKQEGLDLSKGFNEAPLKEKVIWLFFISFFTFAVGIALSHKDNNQ